MSKNSSQTTNHMLPPIYRSSQLAYCFTLLSTSTLAVVLRLWAKGQISRYGWDDALIILAWISLVGILGVNIRCLSVETLQISCLTVLVGVTGIFGYPLGELSDDSIVEVLRAAWVVSVLCAPCITFCKLSVLEVYRIVFNVKERFVIYVKVMSILSLAWGIGHTAAFLSRCMPIREAWNPDTAFIWTHGTKGCESPITIVAIAEPINTLQDLIIVLMPLGVLRSLNLSTHRKVSLSLIFLCGIFVVVASVVRIVWTVTPRSWDRIDVIHSSAKILHVQLTLAIICACVLTYGPLYPKIRGVDRLRRWYIAATPCFRSRGKTDMPRSNQGSVPSEIPYDHPSTQRSDISTVIVSDLENQRRWSGRESQCTIPRGSIQVEKTLNIAIQASEDT
ncbi:hypothetical protein EJ05DRAFT_481850 [Pseudovirgaria hyperparasitica]|uniref:Rhodopsin domain-containing protein n=1 Tax=Pseudovirgaria hyperparasitica TaxID=470096 RepID=A0A6A6WLB1_9PEZI|nr:uncharacterized protein EJ05DRAFT_481850 [Pseudovirgaria hyperparasitica]KAF2762995.1 hypothetical protein EJ05DRAFT_481850 [Pseudovirgaria hyperparasitica]